MSLLGAISNSLAGMRAIQADMQVISGNVSNAQNANYTRKTINLSADTVSGGVVVTGYSRATNKSLDTLLQQSLGDSGLRSSQSEYLTAIQDLLGSSQDQPILTNAVSDFAAAWRQLAAAPESVAQQQDVLFKAQNFVREVNRLSTGLQSIAVNIQNDTKTTVFDLNSRLNEIHDLNLQIVSANGGGQEATANNLMDQRDSKVRELSKLLNVRVFERSQGTIALYTPEGLSLLDSVPNQFTWTGAAVTLDPSGTDVTAALKGGRLEALTGLLDQGSTPAALNDPGKASVYKLQQQLTRLVTMFTSASSPHTFANAYDNAASGTGELAASFFTGTTPGNFAVNSNLTDGTSKLKQASAVVIAADMDVNTRSFTVAGLTVTNTSYTGYTDAMIGTQNQNLQVIRNQADLYEAQAKDYTQRLQSDTGVNLDDEMALLAQLQNNYAATARVISTIQQMFQAVQNL